MSLSYLTKYGKIIALVSALITTILGYQKLKSHWIETGKQIATNTIQERANKEIVKATQAAIDKAQAEVDRSLVKQQAIFDKELERVKEERIVEIQTKEVIKNVETVKIRNECSIVPDPIIRLLNKSIGTANGTANSRTEGD